MASATSENNTISDRLADHFNGLTSHPARDTGDASGPALLFIQAEIGAVVRGVKAGEFDYPT